MNVAKSIAPVRRGRKESWKPAVGYEGIYEVSSRGRVRRIVLGGNARPGPCRRLSANRGGYCVLRLYRDRTGFSEYVHSLVTSAFLGKRPPGQTVHHRNGNKLDNRVANLEYVDASSHLSAHVRGERYPGAKLTASDVRRIRGLLREGMAQRRVADVFGVGRTTVGAIATGQNWAS